MTSSRSVLLGFLLLALAGILGAQVGTQGTILGVVQDESGAVIPGAEVKVTRTETGISHTATSDASGNFQIRALPIGHYSVQVSSPGFKTWTLEDTEITVGEISRVSPVLSVGQVTEQITVESTQELLQTEKGSVETVIQSDQITQLPLSDRNPAVLVNLVPGMRFISEGGPERASYVQGFGTRSYQTQFQLDGLNANAAMDEGGMTIPNVDTIAEFNVQTNSFSAENGRNPLQVVMVTKSGSNEFHGTLWEFFQNDNLNARNAFAVGVPKLRRNQFGAAAGGPVIKNRTFFFGSFQGTPIRQDQIFNSTVVQPEMLQGDFSSLSKAIIDPATGEPFPGNQIPTDRFSSASEYFFPYLLQPNSPDGRFRAISATKDDTWEYTARIDHNFTDSQRLYGRYVMVDNSGSSPGYRPDYTADSTTRQHNLGVNYTNTLSPSLLLTVAGGYIRSDNRVDSAIAGSENFTAEAGIQGIPTEGRERFVGLPNINLTGYTGISTPGFGTPLRLWSDAWNFKADLNYIRGNHTLAFGYQFDDRAVFGNHGSHSPRGSFDFNGQYTGDAFADYLLGYAAATRRNYPLAPFGMDHAPYSGIYAQDLWQITPTFTLSLGLRFERWHEHSLRNGNGSTFDIATGKVIAGVDDNGNVDLSAQPVAPYLAAATTDLWIPATEAGIPNGLYEGNNNWSPRISFAWRPFGSSDVVVRSGYGIFYNTFTGNRAASSIVGLPYWTWESLEFGPQEPQSWQTAWPADPQSFIQPSVGEAPAYDLKPTQTHEWNFSVQLATPAHSALTLSYIGTAVRNQAVMQAINEVPPGSYENLQAAKPYSAFGQINVLHNLGRSDYHGFQAKWERRFMEGLSFMASYSFAKDLATNSPDAETDRLTPYAPEGYLRGRSGFDRRHILFANVVWELPFGTGKPWGSDLGPVANAFLGGWQISAINSFTSGAPLTISVPGATLGNGWGTRADLVGDPSISDPTAEQWFNTNAFAAPAPYTFGSSGIGLLDGPASHVLDLGLMKNFHFSETRYLQFRWEMFNALNKVNYDDPGTTLGTSNFGVITGASAARTMQLGLKFYF